jgi:cytochrome P450
MTITEPQVKDPDAPLAFDPTDHHFLRDPYRRYAELRESPVLHHSTEGLWVLTRHADVQAAVRDPRLSSDPRHAVGRRRERQASLPIFNEGGPKIMLLADPPDHTRLRRLANKAFTPRAVEALRPRVGAIVDELLDAAATRGEGTMDLMADLAEPLPVIVICELLGVPVEDQEQFKPWSTAIARMLDANADPALFDEAVPAVLGFVQYFGELMEQRRQEPRDDLLSGLLQAEADGDKLDQGELFAMVILLFIAGHETTTNLLGNGTLALLRNRDQFEALRADPGLAGPATDELLRYDSPVQITARTATEDLEVNGIRLDKGEGVVCGLAAANRDPRYRDEPDRLDLAAGRPSHLSFSNGMHHCLGAPLARLEGQVVFTALTQRFPDLELADDDPPYRDHFVLRGLSSLPVSLG